MFCLTHFLPKAGDIDSEGAQFLREGLRRNTTLKQLSMQCQAPVFFSSQWMRSICNISIMYSEMFVFQFHTLCSSDFDFPPGSISPIAAAVESNTALTELSLSSPKGNPHQGIPIDIEDAQALRSMLQRNVALLDLDLRGKLFFCFLFGSAFGNEDFCSV